MFVSYACMSEWKQVDPARSNSQNVPEIAKTHFLLFALWKTTENKHGCRLPHFPFFLVKVKDN